MTPNNSRPVLKKMWFLNYKNNHIRESADKDHDKRMIDEAIKKGKITKCPTKFVAPTTK